MSPATTFSVRGKRVVSVLSVSWWVSCPQVPAFYRAWRCLQDVMWDPAHQVSDTYEIVSIWTKKLQVKNTYKNLSTWTEKQNPKNLSAHRPTLKLDPEP